MTYNLGVCYGGACAVQYTYVVSECFGDHVLYLQFEHCFVGHVYLYHVSKNCVYQGVGHHDGTHIWVGGTACIHVHVLSWFTHGDGRHSLHTRPCAELVHTCGWEAQSAYTSMEAQSA